MCLFRIQFLCMSFSFSFIQILKSVYSNILLVETQGLDILAPIGINEHDNITVDDTVSLNTSYP